MIGMNSLSTTNWWVLVLRGVLAVIFAFITFVWPGISLAALILLFGAYSLVDGIFAVVASLQRVGRQPRWWAMLLEGILGIIAGIVTFFWPGITALVLLIIIGVWAVMGGVFEIAAAIELRKQIENEWMLVLSGVFSIIFGLIVLIFPGAGALSLLWLIASYALIFGILLISLGVRMRSLQHDGRQGLAV
ncbi:MAG: HdeD family acid-resistance protein [Chloroflexi bacterium]|nr:HdeD family acid-resistance protein [Chloroflexota bacterium]OJV88225.1 MAG: hypothetical protein BGO39_08540 [Chloroflexi bacterium 54-19]